MIAKLEKTLITKQRQNTEPLQTIEATINSGSIIIEPCFKQIFLRYFFTEPLLCILFKDHICQTDFNFGN